MSAPMPAGAGAVAETEDPIGLLLRITEGTKSYRGMHAIEGVNFDLRPGEVHALVGENGAGKSTLCKVISGAIELSSGELEVGGRQVTFARPSDALAEGIAMVYQETSLVPTMTAAQNIELGHEKLLTRFRSLNISAQQLLQSMNFHVDPTAYVATLGAAQKQMVEIARALRSQAKVVIFDEPSASLTPEETQHLFHVIGDLRRAGMGIIYVSHALEESLKLADRITVLRDGKHIATRATADVDRDEIVGMMVGRAIAAGTRRVRGENRGKRTLEVQNVTMGTIVKNMSFTAYAGEVLGIAGLIGSGRTEIAKIIIGALKRNRLHGGQIILNGKSIRYRVPKQAINDGIVYITEDRKRNGFFETLSIRENLYLGKLASRSGQRTFVSRTGRQKLAEEMIDKLRIRTLNAAAKVVELSGGNQQKVVVAKALAQEPDVIIFDEPTRGVDVGTIEEIHQLIRDLADQGKTVIVISSYLPEVLSVSDRILVARLGRIAAEFQANEATQEDLMYAAIF